MNLELFATKSANPDFVMTECASNVRLACTYAKANGDISLVFGDAGLGKTISLLEYVRSDKDAIYIELNHTDKSPKGVCERILDVIGRQAWGVDRKLVNEITDYLKSSQKIIILDEAQHLNQRALETIRGINDKSKTGIVLCGNPIVYDQMHGKRQAYFAQLYSRIGIRRRVTSPSKQEISQIFTKSPLNDDCCEFLYALSLEDGGLRNAVKVYNMSVNLATTAHNELALPHLKTAYKLVYGVA